MFLDTGCVCAVSQNESVVAAFLAHGRIHDAFRTLLSKTHDVFSVKPASRLQIETLGPAPLRCRLTQRCRILHPPPPAPRCLTARVSSRCRFQVWHYSGTLLTEQRLQGDGVELWEAAWQPAPPGRYPEPRVSHTRVAAAADGPAQPQGNDALT